MVSGWSAYLLIIDLFNKIIAIKDLKHLYFNCWYLLLIWIFHLFSTLSNNFSSQTNKKIKNPPYAKCFSLCDIPFLNIPHETLALSGTQPPPAPTIITVAAYSHQINIQWEHPESSYVLVQGYLLGYGENIPDIVVQRLDGSARYYEIKHLELNTNYVIKLRAYNQAGEGQSVYSNVRTSADSSKSTLHAVCVVRSSEMSRLFIFPGIASCCMCYLPCMDSLKSFLHEILTCKSGLWKEKMIMIIVLFLIDHYYFVWWILNLKHHFRAKFDSVLLYWLKLDFISKSDTHNP